MGRTETEEPEDTAEPEGAGLPAEQEDRIVDKVVSRIKPLLEDARRTVLGDRDSHAGPEDGEEEDEPAAEPSSPRQIEAVAEDAVRAAVERISSEKEHEEHHKHLKEAERPPQQFSKLTKALWGDR